MLRAGGQIGEFHIRRLLGRGGMGEVYEAFEPGLGRLVALKVLPEWLADEPGALDRFQREAATAAQLEHPRIVPIFFWGEADGRCFFTMKLIQGVPLSRMIQRRRLREQMPQDISQEGSPDAETPRGPAASTDKEQRQPHDAAEADASLARRASQEQAGREAAADEPLDGSDSADAAEVSQTMAAETVAAEMLPPGWAFERAAAADLHHDLSALFEKYCEDRFEFAARVGEQLADALDYAHRQGQIHRDFKPSNVMIDRHGDVYLIDFGLTRAITPDATRHLCGTLRYMSPEQLDFRPLDGRSDIYSLGVTLYEIVSPGSPFDGPDESAIAEQIRDGAVQPLELAVPDVPERLAQCIRRAMHPQPEARYETAAALRDELAACRSEMGAAERVLTSRWRLPWKPSLLALASLLIAILAAGLPWHVWLAIGTEGGSENAAVAFSVIVGEDGIGRFRNSIGMEFVVVRRGSFMMGAAKAEVGSIGEEWPVHMVHITRDFGLGPYEVTQNQYSAVMGENPSHFTAEELGVADAGAYPVDSISWRDAQAFCEKLSELPAERAAGRRYRLPTEAEWEYACRAGTVTPFYFGQDLSSDQAHVNGREPYGRAPYAESPLVTRPVGSYRPNAFGLYDMHGNVQEWCQDCFANYTLAEQYDPVALDRGPNFERMMRGGFFDARASDSRSAARYPYAPDSRHKFGGFRVAVDVPQKE